MTKRKITKSLNSRDELNHKSPKNPTSSTKSNNDLGETLDSLSQPFLFISLVEGGEGKYHCRLQGDPITQLGMLRVMEKLILKNIEGLEK